MNLKEHPSEKTFLIRECDLERIRELKAHPFCAQNIKKVRENIEQHVKVPVKAWDGTDWSIRPIPSHKQLPKYLLDAALLYLLTGEEELAQACRRDVMTCVKVSESNKEGRISAASLQERTYNLAIIFINEWLSEYFSNEERQRIRKACLGCIRHHAGEIARFTVEGKIIQNHILHDSFGLSMVALYFNDFADSDRWVEFATDTAVKYLQEAFNEDGAQNEVAVSYHAGCISDAVYLAQIMRDFADRDLMKEEWFQPVIEPAIEWLASLVTPQGTIVAFNDSVDTIPQWYFRFGASQFNNPHFQAIADIINETETRSFLLYDLLFFEPEIEPKLNTDARTVFPVSGTAAFRTGFGDTDGMLAQKVGSYSGGHAHLDRLGFEFWHNGTCVFKDPVGGNHAYFKDTSVHNVIGIPDPEPRKLQISRFTPDVMIPVPHLPQLKSKGTFLKTEDAPDYSLLVGQAEIYKDINQTRTLVWIKKAAILIVYDMINADKTYTFDQIFHGIGTLAIEKNSFVFRNDKQICRGSLLLPVQADIIEFANPEQAEGADSFTAFRAEGKEVEFLTLIEISEDEDLPGRELKDKTIILELGEGDLNIKLDNRKLSVRLDKEQIL